MIAHFIYLGAQKCVDPGRGKIEKNDKRREIVFFHLKFRKKFAMKYGEVM